MTMDFYFLDTDSPDLHSVAIMEAKKWLEEKKSGLDTNSDVAYGSPCLNLFALPQVSDSQFVKKLYCFLYMLYPSPFLFTYNIYIYIYIYHCDMISH